MPSCLDKQLPVPYISYPTYHPPEAAAVNPTKQQIQSFRTQIGIL